MRSGKIFDNLRQIDQENIGAIDNTTGYICRHFSNATVEDILNGNVDRWEWKTITAEEAEDSDPCIMFVKHVDQNPTLAAILKKLNLHIPGITNLNSVSGQINNKTIRVGISGIVVGGILFVRDKFKACESINAFATHEDLQARRGISLDKFYLSGRFDLTLCSYYCDFGQ